MKRILFIWFIIIKSRELQKISQPHLLLYHILYSYEQFNSLINTDGEVHNNDVQNANICPLGRIHQQHHSDVFME